MSSAQCGNVEIYVSLDEISLSDSPLNRFLLLSKQVQTRGFDMWDQTQDFSFTVSVSVFSVLTLIVFYPFILCLHWNATGGSRIKGCKVVRLVVNRSQPTLANQWVFEQMGLSIVSGWKQIGSMFVAGLVVRQNESLALGFIGPKQAHTCQSSRRPRTRWWCWCSPSKCHAFRFRKRMSLWVSSWTLD